MNDPDLQQSFDRLRAVHQEIAPAFGSLRSHAMAAARQPAAWHPAWAGATVLTGVILVMLWFAVPWQREGATPTPEQLEQLTRAIDQHLEARDALNPWQSPTDILLTSINP